MDIFARYKISKSVVALTPSCERKTPINAYGAYLQQVLNKAPESTTDPIIYSSWLCPIASGKIKDGGNEGSFEQHVMVAVSHYEPQKLELTSC
jgi:hypothetical protein